MSDDKQVFYGKVLWFNPSRGFGFLEWEKDGTKQKDMFCHFSDVVCEGFKTLYKDQNVSFQIGTNNHGDPKATCVQVLRN